MDKRSNLERTLSVTGSNAPLFKGGHEFVLATTTDLFFIKTQVGIAWLESKTVANCV